jgi:hypothetical protein
MNAISFREGSSRTENCKRISYAAFRKLVQENDLLYPRDIERPRTRGDCESGERPCPWVSCKWNLYLDVDPCGSIKYNFPSLEPGEMKTSCALDVADHPQGDTLGGESTLDEVAQALHLTRERVRQIERKAFNHIRKRLARAIDWEQEP